MNRLFLALLLVGTPVTAALAEESCEFVLEDELEAEAQASNRPIDLTRLTEAEFDEALRVATEISRYEYEEMREYVVIGGFEFYQITRWSSLNLRDKPEGLLNRELVVMVPKACEIHNRRITVRRR